MHLVCEMSAMNVHRGIDIYHPNPSVPSEIALRCTAHVSLGMLLARRQTAHTGHHDRYFGNPEGGLRVSMLIHV